MWLYPVGWADVGYSPAEVAIKEVYEETGIEVEVRSLIACFDGLRLGFARLPMYSIVFHCPCSAASCAGHPLETRQVGFFGRDDLPWPLAGVRAGSTPRSPPSTASRARRLRPPAHPTLARQLKLRDASPSPAPRAARGDRDAARRVLPRAADALVVDEATGVGRDAERLGRRARSGRLQVVAIDGKALEPVPQRRERWCSSPDTSAPATASNSSSGRRPRALGTPPRGAAATRA